MRRVLLVAILAVLLLAACGTDDTGTGREDDASSSGAVGAPPAATNDCPDCALSSDGTVSPPQDDGQDPGGGSEPGFAGTGDILCPAPTLPGTGEQATPEAGVSCDPVPTVEPGPPCKPGLEEAAELDDALVGCVLDTEGRPVVGAFLDLKALTAVDPIPDIGVLTNERGRYAHTMLPQGRYAVTIRAEGYKVPPRKTVTLEDDTVNADFVLQRK